MATSSATEPVSSRLARAFGDGSQAVARAAGKPAAFCLATLSVLAWALLGPVFGFSDNWQLVINTSTTIITFLMVFLIQNTQNRDSEALHIKLDELIRAIKGANNAVIDLEALEEDQLDRIRAMYAHLAEKARGGEQHGKQDAAIVYAQLDGQVGDQGGMQRRS